MKLWVLLAIFAVMVLIAGAGLLSKWYNFTVKNFADRTDRGPDLP